MKLDTAGPPDLGVAADRVPFGATLDREGRRTITLVVMGRDRRP